jgi:hypothetical protein
MTKAQLLRFFTNRIPFSEGVPEDLPRKKNSLIKLEYNRESKGYIYLFIPLRARCPVGSLLHNT